MSKRLTRIFASALPQALSRIINQEVHVVLYNGHTVFGCLESFDSICLEVRDLRGHLHRVLLSDIEEVIQDRPGIRPVARA